ncbi:MAG: EAL domain-containing protein, partial [Rhodocyclaceae bacterium]|nr:EAL domain-containing protein [Rhodocyclaceae bacterium]
RSFVVEAAEDSGALTIIRTIVSLSRSFGLKVVAEGIETEAQAAMLRDAGCDLLQGYLYARPVPASEIDFAAPRSAVRREA